MTDDQMLVIIAEECKRSTDSYFTNPLQAREHRTTFLSFKKCNQPSKVLFIAHCDTVFDESRPMKVKTYKKSQTIKSGALDDRVGVALATRILPEILPHSFDVILTDLEERGRSTASTIDPKCLEQYNHIIGLDRRGSDVVTYDLDSPEYLAALKSSGFVIGEGSFSDICSIDSEHCRFNMGVGYHNEHSLNCTFYLDELKLQLECLKKFLNANLDIAYKTDPDDFSWDRDPWNVYDDQPDSVNASNQHEDLCDECFSEIAPNEGVEDLNGFRLCPSCAEDLQVLK